MSTQGSGYRSHSIHEMSSILTSPPDLDESRRMLQRSDLSLDFSDNESHVQGSLPPFTSSQLDSLFHAPDLSCNYSFGGTADAGLHQSSLVLPPLRFPQVAPVSSFVAKDPGGVHEAVSNAMNRRSRHCCFLFRDWPFHKPVIVDNVRRIVQELAELRKSSANYGITLSDSPTYFLNKEGPGVYMVLSSSSTYVTKWKQVGETIHSTDFRPIFRETGVRSGQHGFENIGRLFKLTLEEIAQLHINRVSCEKLPEVAPCPASVP